ncbi:ParB/RepB/Spo0J family partition protein [uncultured Hyphomonas sp.]|uniref:ParB/RepB/Spo0J family partition protein n=3 Tax=Hyphomonas TaxID=85 RepID=UPI000C6C30BA|nr:partitioning protein [Hyphomonadaceae bacterium]|tara:strand:+ start:15471 stop:17498 length:2028 start_codon:yes stop_codon:yes gene_type:complete
MSRALTEAERILGPRPQMTLVVEDDRVVEIWIAGRAPHIRVRDYDWGRTDPAPAFDREGFPYSDIHWSGPAWALGLSLYPPEKETPMAQPDLTHIPLDKLSVSKLNMRHGRKKPDVSDILPSIREKGIRQTLLVRREGDGYGVIAGRRRYFALLELAKETGTNPLVPCAIMSEEDAASAIEASIIENVARLPATEMEQYVAFRKLADEGKTPEDIATFFGVTELLVRRVLALAGLAAPIRKLYSEDEIDRETIRALTLATPAQQAEWLKLWNSETERAPFGRSCKAWVTGGSTITTDKALFELDQYTGAVTSDLFGERAVFADAEAFWTAQAAEVSARIEQLLARGWADVVCLERGTYFQRWEYVQTTKKKGGKVYVEQRQDGTVMFHEGWLTASEARKKSRQDINGDGSVQTDIKPEMSGPMAEYVGLHRHGAAAASLLAAPAIALRLMAAHALTGSSLWNVRPHVCGARKNETHESVSGSAAWAEIDAASERVEAMFSALGAMRPRSNGDAYSLCETFSALLAMSDEEVMKVLALTMAETLEAGGPVVEAVLHVCGTDLGRYWSPDDAFFDLLRDKRAINALVADISSPSVAESVTKESGKVQKALIQNRIEGVDCTANPGWRPGWMQVPPTGLVEGAGCATVEAWTRIAGLFEGEDEDNTQPEVEPCEADAA